MANLWCKEGHFIPDGEWNQAKINREKKQLDNDELLVIDNELTPWA